MSKVWFNSGTQSIWKQFENCTKSKWIWKL